jgi:putative membrane protein
MNIAATGFVYLVGLLHVWFMVLESFLWTKPLGLKTFGMTPQMAEATKVLAQNQGLYNGFLAAGCFWAACSGDPKLNYFFLICVIIAGVVGAFTASKNIIFVQALPALIALVLFYLSHKAAV